MAPTTGSADHVSGADEALVAGECDAANRRRMTFMAPMAMVMHAVSVWMWRGMAAGPVEVRRWAENLRVLHEVMFVLALGTLVVATTRRQGAQIAWLKPRMATVISTSYVIWGALISANSQLARPNVEVYTYVSLAMAVMLIVPTAPLAVAQAAGGLFLLAVIGHFQDSPALFRGQLINVVAVGMIGVMLSRVFYRNFRQQVSDRLTIEKQKSSLEARQRDLETLNVDLEAKRRDLETLNHELEERVEAKVKVALEQTRELERLNVRLQERVRERSRELSQALSKIAGERGDQAALRPGTVLGERTRIVRQLAAGGMGVVYEGLDLETSEPVAVKVVPPALLGDTENLQRFLREGLAAASVAHPAVVRTLHVDVDDGGLLFQVQELIEGVSLRQVMDSGRPLAPLTAARLIAEVAGALAAAHASGVVHRDIKPGNIMLTRREPGVVLIDFGISRLAGNDLAAVTQPGAIMGTPEYLSPEQVARPDDVGPPTDVYSLAVTLYRMIGHESPFGAISSVQFLMAHATGTPRPLGDLAPDAPPELAEVVMACLAKSPAARPDAATLQARLTALADRSDVPRLHELSTRWLAGWKAPDATSTHLRQASSQSSIQPRRALDAGPQDSPDVTLTSTSLPSSKPASRS